MPTTTAPLDVVSDAAVLDVLERAGRPLSTLDVRIALGHRADVATLDEVPITRLRRSLDRLEAQEKIIGSGGPKRAELMGWPVTDGRDVQWATIEVAERIKAEQHARVEAVVEAQNERAQLLRDLHARCVHSQRAGLKIIGIGKHLSADVTYRDPEGGASTWSLEELRVVCELAGIDAF